MYYFSKKIFFFIIFIVFFYPNYGICQLNTTAPWPMFHHDNRHTGKTPRFGTQIGKLKWLVVTGGPVTSSPAIDENGIVYVGSADNNLYAIDGESGVIQWKYQTDGPINHSSPAIDVNGVVYIGSYDGYLYAFDTKTINSDDGTTWTYKWRFETDGPGAIASSPAITPDGSILFGSADGFIYSVYPDGTLKWKTKIGIIFTSSPAIDDKISQVYIGTTVPDVFFTLDMQTGAIIWLYDFLCGGVYASPSIATDGSIYFCNATTYYTDESCLDEFKFQVYNFPSDGGIISAITPTANPNWKLDLGNNDIYTTPALLEDNTFFIGSGPNFYRILPDGQTYWSQGIDGQRIESSPAVDGSKFIYVGTNGGRFYCLQADRPEPDTTIVWRYPRADEDPLEAPILSSPAIGNDERHSIYVGASDDNVYAFYDGIRIKGKVNLVDGSGNATQRRPLQAVKIILKSELLSSDKITNTDANGIYEFAGLENGVYTVTPERQGYIFSPESLTITIKDKDFNNANFEAFGGFGISGFVSDKNGQALLNVAVSIEGSSNKVSETVQTDGIGFYQFTGLGFDTYTITPFLEGYGFTPPFQNVTISSIDAEKNKTNINFTATLGYQISGKVTDIQGTGIKGVNITIVGAQNDSTVTDDNGAYSFIELDNGTYTVTPLYSNYDFNPPSQTVTIASASVLNVDFTAAIGSNVSGYVFEGDKPLTGVSINLINTSTDEITQTAETDISGIYSFVGVVNGSYTVKPTLAGYGFNPLSKFIQVTGNDLKNINFRATKGLYIGGKVTNLLNMPLSNVTLDLTSDTGQNIDSNSTDTAGQYVFLGLQPGIYTVTVSAEGYQAVPSSQTVDVLAESIEDLKFLAIPTCPIVFVNIPSAGSSGTAVNIIGINFGLSEPEEGTTFDIDGTLLQGGVYFGPDDPSKWIKAEVQSWSPVRIIAKAPAGGSVFSRIWVINETGCIYKPAQLTNFFIYGL